MRFVIVTGLSGAGKSEAIKSFEDIGYFCIDNLPPAMIPKFAEACYKTEGKIDKIALVIDIRGREFFDDLFESLEFLKENNYEYEILFLDASDEVLVKRYKETRRKHPLAPNDRIINGINLERQKLKELKNRANHIIDTSKLKVRDLKEKIIEIYAESGQLENEFAITVISFGFKYGIPVDSDLVFDVRFLPNPFYIPEMKELTGNDDVVMKYILSKDMSKEFIQKLTDLLDFLIPGYMAEGKKQLIISIGCTGGRHRSVVIANSIYEKLKSEGRKVNIDHRDIDEDVIRNGKKL